MPRYIDADKLCEGRVSNDPVVIAAGCEPTADAQKIVHAHWITNFSSTRLLCSHCRQGRTHKAFIPTHGLYKHYEPFPVYCENCGARMDGGDQIAEIEKN